MRLCFGCALLESDALPSPLYKCISSSSIITCTHCCANMVMLGCARVAGCYRLGVKFRSGFTPSKAKMPLPKPNPSRWRHGDGEAGGPFHSIHAAPPADVIVKSEMTPVSNGTPVKTSRNHPFRGPGGGGGQFATHSA